MKNSLLALVGEGLEKYRWNPPRGICMAKLLFSGDTVHGTWILLGRRTFSRSHCLTWGGATKSMMLDTDVTTTAQHNQATREWRSDHKLMGLYHKWAPPHSSWRLMVGCGWNCCKTQTVIKRIFRDAKTNVKMKERPGKEFGDDESKHQARHCVHSNVNSSHRTILPPFLLPNTTRPAFTRDFKAWQKNQQRTYWKPTLT